MFRRILAQYKRLVVFVAAAYGGALLLGVLARRPNTALYSSVIILLVAVFAGVHLWIGLPDRLLWALAILGLFHLAGGLIPLSDDRILYNLPLAPFPLQLDRLVHAFGSAVVALVAWHALRPNLVTSDRVPWAAVVLVGAAGMGVRRSRRWPSSLRSASRPRTSAATRTLGGISSSISLGACGCCLGETSRQRGRHGGHR